MTQAESPAKVSKSQQVVLTVPPTLGAMVHVVQPALDRLAIGEGGLRLLVLVPDADTAHALAAAVRPSGDPAPLLVPITSPARGVRLLGQSPVAIAGSPRDIAALLPSGQLKLGELAQLLVLQADLTLALADAADLEAIAADLPKELPRTVTTAVETEAVAAFVKAYMKRPRRVGDEVVPEDARPLSLQFVPVTVHTRALALRRVLDAVNAPSAIVVANDDAAREEAEAALRTLGYAGDAASPVQVHVGGVETHSALRVLWDVPPTREGLEAALGGAPAHAVVLVTPRQVAHLRLLLAGGALTQLVLTEALSEAERRKAAQLAQIRAVLAGGLSVAELQAVEGLLAEHDAMEIAAAALRLLDQEQATVRALRVGVTTLQPAAKKDKGEAAPALVIPPRARAADDAPAADAAPAGDEGAAAPAPRASRRSEPATTTGVEEWKLVFINVGARDGATAGTLVGAITGESGLDRGVIGAIDLRDTHTLVEIAADQAERVVTALTGSTIRGRDVTARIDQVGGRIDRGPRGGAPRGGGRSFGGDRGGDRGPRGGFGGGRGGFSRDDRGPRGGGGFGGGRPFQRDDRGPRPGGGFRRDEGDAPRGRPFQRREEGDAPRGRPFQRDDRAPRGGGGFGGGRPFQRDDRGPRPGGFRRDEGGAPRRGFDRRDEGADRAERLERSRRPLPGARKFFRDAESE